MQAKLSNKKEIIGFGFIPEESEHHFLVDIQSKEIVIAEQFEYNPKASLADLSYKIGKQNSDVKVMIPRARWDLIADGVRAEFNRRLKNLSLPLGKWTSNRNYVSRLLGKELVLLAWAIEEADPGLYPVAIQNWIGLKPEERWWLYTMTNAATGHAIYDRGVGWRKAVRFALTENPVSGLKPNSKLDLTSDLSLFKAEDPSDLKWNQNESTGD